MEIKIVQQNLDSHHNKCDIEKVMDRLLVEGPDVLMLSEFDYLRHQKTVVDRLKPEYSMKYPIGFLKIIQGKVAEKSIGRLKTVCVIAVKKEISEGKLKFEHKECKELAAKRIADKHLRYIAGTLSIKRSAKGQTEIKLFFTHVPPDTFYNRENRSDLLLAAYCFWRDHKRKYAFFGGDFNSEIERKTTFWPLFKKLYDATNDTEPNKEKTYKHTDGRWFREDYALASKSLASRCRTEPPIDTTQYGTDHKALLTTIKL